MATLDPETVAAIRGIIREEVAALANAMSTSVPSVELQRPTDPTKQGGVVVKAYNPSILTAGAEAAAAFQQGIRDADKLAPMKPK